VFLFFFIIGVNAIIYNQISANLSSEVMVSPVVFTNGEDTIICGGSFYANDTQVKFTCIPLAVESNITITQLVNITNTDSSNHYVHFFVTENFETELSLLSIYLVSPSGIELLVVSINDSGVVTTENISINIPPGEEWTIKLEGHYDSGTPITQSNTMSITIQVQN